MERETRGGTPRPPKGGQAGRPHKTLLTAAQTAGGIKEILPVAEIMRRLVTETEAALLRAGASA
jgi:NAD(P)H-dependent flavin oxidoreductase YrpB (nitropropane dioxygenase family)